MTRPLRSYVLMRKSGVAADRRDFARSVTLALAASHDSDQVGPELRALTLRQVAITHALAGDGKASQPARRGACYRPGRWR